MRKKEGHTKIGKQLGLFADRIISLHPILLEDSGTISRSNGESAFFSLLARNRALTGTLLETVMSPTNLNQAYESVKRNGGTAGVDQMDVEELGYWLRKNGKTLIDEVLNEGYEPSAVLGVSIPKSNGGERLLGIPTVLDRLIQQSIHQQLGLLYEPLFSSYSYGFRPGRSALQAVEQASEYISEGYQWVVDIDLASFFDTINHDRLMQRLHKGIGDKRLLRLIRKYLKAGMMQGGLEHQRISGTPQGGPLSPILSNIVLDELDKELEKRGHKFVRYADDCNIYVKSRKAGEQVLKSITRFIESKLKLKVNREKSGVRRCEQVNFLGYTMMPDGKIRIADKSIARFRKKVRQVTKRNRGLRFDRIITELNTMTRGWVNYFRKANTWMPWRGLDEWMRRRLRCYRLKQCGRRYTIFKFLRQLGAKENPAWNAIMYAGGWWNLSLKPVCGHAMSNNWFQQNGLYTLENLFKRVNR